MKNTRKKWNYFCNALAKGKSRPLFVINLIIHQLNVFCRGKEGDKKEEKDKEKDKKKKKKKDRSKDKKKSNSL